MQSIHSTDYANEKW